MPDLATLYRFRFRESERAQKTEIWRVLCDEFFQSITGDNSTILDLACGYGEFINNIRAGKKYAVDLNPDARLHLNSEVEFLCSPANAISSVADSSIDVVFTSNFLEHLKSKDDCDAVLSEVLRILRPGGRFIVMGPNIRYLAAQYWDFYDHYLPLSHLSLEEGLIQAGYSIERIVPKFLPYTTRSALPKHAGFVKLYLNLPIVWRLFGKQFLLIGKKPSA
jgi:ubiquinone/menaquinone biosynthesis C-methylase UbiE